MAEMAWAFEERLLVAANTKADVPAAEWDAFLAQLRAHAEKHWQDAVPCVLVFTEGGGPNAGQRKALLERVPQILQQGLEWLELRGGERAAIAAAMGRMRREVGDRVRCLPRAM